MNRVRTTRCVCCRLDQDITVGDTFPSSAPTCSRCAGHRGDTLEHEAARETEHALMYRRALEDAEDDARVAHGERDFYRDRMRTASDDHELLIGVLAAVGELHRRVGERCSCTGPGCRIGAWLADPRIGRLIGTGDEQSDAARELRAANPAAWEDDWDYLDVSLVYPPPPRRRDGRGRHRAAG